MYSLQGLAASMESTTLFRWSLSPFPGMSQGEDVKIVSVSNMQVVSRFFELTTCTREVNVTTTITDNGSNPVHSLEYPLLQTINITEVCFVFYE